MSVAIVKHTSNNIEIILYNLLTTLFIESFICVVCVIFTPEYSVGGRLVEGARPRIALRLHERPRLVGHLRP